MSDFAETVKNDTPRLVVMYRRNENAKGASEEFQWGIVGSMPVLSLIGYISRVQHDMIGQLAEQRNECPEKAFVIAMTEQGMDWWTHRDIPVDSLVGMLEAIKAALIGGRVAQHAASQRILGPDGTPLTR